MLEQDLHHTTHGDETSHGQRLAGQTRQRRVVKAGLGCAGIIFAALFGVWIVFVECDGAESDHDDGRNVNFGFQSKGL